MKNVMYFTEVVFIIAYEYNYLQNSNHTLDLILIMKFIGKYFFSSSLPCAEYGSCLE